MMTEPSTDTHANKSEQPAVGKRGFSYGGAMGLVVLAAINVGQLLVVVPLNVTDRVDWDGNFSRGGAVVLIAIFVTWATCRGWEQWRKLAWAWGGGALLLAFTFTNVQAQYLIENELPSTGTAFEESAEVDSPELSSLECKNLEMELQRLENRMEESSRPPSPRESPGSLWDRYGPQPLSDAELETYGDLNFQYRTSC